MRERDLESSGTKGDHTGNQATGWVSERVGGDRGSAADQEILDEMLGLVTQLPVEDELPAPLQQQQLIKGLKDVDAGLVDGAHNGPARVDNVAHCAHHNGCCSRIQACISLIC